MFEIMKIELENGRRKSVAFDEDRDVTFESLGGYRAGDMATGSCFKMVWKGMEIHMDMEGEQVTESDGSWYASRWFVHCPKFYVGGRARHNIQQELKLDDLPPIWEPKDQEEEEEARLLAVEAFLIYGDAGIGLRSPDGQVRVKLSDGRVFQKRDFNIPTIPNFRPQVT